MSTDILMRSLLQFIDGEKGARANLPLHIIVVVAVAATYIYYVDHLARMQTFAARYKIDIKIIFFAIYVLMFCFMYSFSSHFFFGSLYVMVMSLLSSLFGHTLFYIRIRFVVVSYVDNI